jgi:transposase
MSARSGCSASRRRCFTTASAGRRRSCAPAPGEPSSIACSYLTTRGSGFEIALAMIDAIEAQTAPLERELRQLARRQTGCRALMRLYGMGEPTSLVTLCELGDVQRLSASRKAVRMAGIDIGVHRSDRRALRRQAHTAGLPAAALGAL